MNRRTISIAIFAVLAAGVAAFFLALSVDTQIYAPGLGRIEWHLGLSDTISARVPHVYQGDFSTEKLLRKIYSVGAFAVVGFFFSPLFARSARFWGSTIVVTGFSLAIEIAQRVVTRISHESNLSSLFDLACGALGGALGALAWTLLEALVRKRSPNAS